MANSERLSYRQIIVGRFPTGFTGLDEIFQSLFGMNKAPTDDLGLELVSRARELNYIPSSAESDFAAALLREYRSYCEQKQTGRETTPKRETWRGIPREQIAWFPMVDETHCDGCDKCLAFCDSGVYGKRDNGVVHVAQPLHCVVGCDACARLCPHKAIAFPPRSMLRTLRR